MASGPLCDSASEVMIAVMRPYAALSFRLDSRGDDGGKGGGIGGDYGRLKSGATRRALLRECALAAFAFPQCPSVSDPVNIAKASGRCAVPFLLPLLGAILRECSSLGDSGGSTGTAALVVLVPWLTQSLEIMLDWSSAVLFSARAVLQCWVRPR